jgi:hypothetical protein
MVQDNQRLPDTYRTKSPCKDCPERFLACSDKCPRDARGEYGYDAWRADCKRIKAEKQKYLDRVHVRMKNYNGGNFYGKE